MPNKHTNARSDAHVLPVRSHILTFTRARFRALFLAAFATGVMAGMSLTFIIVLMGGEA